LHRPDGVTIYAESGNIPGPGQGTNLGKGPKLTADQLKALALDPAWGPIGDALPTHMQ
jgi:hypothetical protein